MASTATQFDDAALQLHLHRLPHGAAALQLPLEQRIRRQHHICVYLLRRRGQLQWHRVVRMLVQQSKHRG